ncbi:MAG: CDP-glycerol glycerophosphotransferase family protein [Parachlamydiaceae bacterium]|nr:CDP-glycerol glycerophosphotransferase family protein [Parachlamydiaceae bacterium]
MQTGWNKKGIALNASSEAHFIDHLAIIALIMDIPLFLFDENCFLLAKKYYPGLQVYLKDDSVFSLEDLTQEYDVLFTTELLGKKGRSFFETAALKHQKKWRSVFCPHGFSDKAFHFELCVLEDITLIYGDNMIDLLHERKVWDQIKNFVVTGNYRYTHFKYYQEFYEKIFQEEIQAHFDKKRPLILYAPTWLDQEASSTFFEATSFLLDQLPEDYNIVVKLHPRLELDDVASCYQIMGRYEKKKNVLFLTNFPLIFPILANTDIYIGDMSSIGYDFLAFDKPLFFLNKQKRDHTTDRGLFLFRCGTEITPDQYGDLFKIIEASLPNDREKFSVQRKEMWHYTFGDKRSFADIKADVIQACIV